MMSVFCISSIYERRSSLMIFIFEDTLKIHCLDFIPIVFYRRGIVLLLMNNDSMFLSNLVWQSKTCYCYVMILEIP